MSDRVRVVKNRHTGVEHTVLAGHWSLASDDYELIEPPSKSRKAKDGATGNDKATA